MTVCEWMEKGKMKRGKGMTVFSVIKGNKLIKKNDRECISRLTNEKWMGWAACIEIEMDCGCGLWWWNCDDIAIFTFFFTSILFLYYFSSIVFSGNLDFLYSLTLTLPGNTPKCPRFKTSTRLKIPITPKNWKLLWLYLRIKPMLIRLILKA